MASIEKLQQQALGYLEQNEQVFSAVMGAYETKIMGNDGVRTGVLLATDRRVVFYAKKMFGYDLEILPYSNISSIEAGKEMLGHVISLFVTGNKLRMKWINKGDVTGFVAVVKSRIGKKDAAPADPASQIKQLAELRDSGLLTQQEFDAKKAEILARM